MRKSKELLDPNFHVRLLRWSIAGVAVFAYLFSITGTVYIGGASSVIIGGLYWRMSTTPAAYTALITGVAMGLLGLVIPKYYPAWPLNGQWMFFVTMCTAITLSIVVSLEPAGEKSHTTSRSFCTGASMPSKASM